MKPGNHKFINSGHSANKNRRIIIRVVAVIEILIGLSISLSFIIASFVNPLGRPKMVYGFVIITSLISVIIGIGIFRYKNWGRQFLIFFSGYVILTKLLFFLNFLEFTGNTLKFIPTNLKDAVSFVYHCGILVIFNLKTIKKELG